jgi:hypothetical protein
MATKAKTKAGRAAERNSSRSQSANRNTERASPSALELLEQDHREVEVRWTPIVRQPEPFSKV